MAKSLSAENAEAWKNLAPASEDVRLHLVAFDRRASRRAWNSVHRSHPKTPEAMALHYIDNLDARLEMFAAGYHNREAAGGAHF